MKAKKEKKKIFIIDLVKYIIADIKERKADRRLYGVDGFVGTWGSGKTISMVELYIKLSREYPDTKFVSNFGLKNCDMFSSIDDVMQYYKQCTENNTNLVIFWDEIQNEFPESDRNFSPMFRLLLTQNRKNAGVYIIWSTQDYTRVNKNIRLMTRYVFNCRTFYKRVTRVRKYERDYYDMFYNTTSIDKKLQIKPKDSYFFLQYDDIRDMYDSFAMLDHVKDKILSSSSP